MRQQVADANGSALVLQVRIVAGQIPPDIIVQTYLALQDGFGHQGSRQGLAQRTDFIEGRIGRRTWLAGFHVAAMTDEFLVPIYDADRSRMKQRLLDQRGGDLIDIVPRSFAGTFFPVQPAARSATDSTKQLNHRPFRTIIEVACMRWRLRGNAERAPKIADCRGPRPLRFSRSRLSGGRGSDHGRQEQTQKFQPSTLADVPPNDPVAGPRCHALA